MIRTWWIGAVISTLAVTGSYAQQGFKQTDRLIKRAEETIKEVGLAKEQLQTTLDAYNGIMKGGSGDTRNTYKALTKAIENTNKRAAEVRKKVDEMEEEAHKFFAEWTASLQNIANEDLKKKGQARLNETRLGFGEILAAGRTARGAFEPFIEGLEDQVVYMGYDLNPSAIASLQADADKVNAQSKQLFETIDAVTKTAKEYVLTLKPE